MSTEAKTDTQSADLIPLVVLLTSAIAATLGARWFRLSSSSLRNAGLKALETVGIAAIFLGANIAAGMIVVAALHALTDWFVSHYILGDVSLLGLSLLQGIVFAWWSSASNQAGPSRGKPADRQTVPPARAIKVGIVVQNDYPHVGLVRPRRLSRSLIQARYHAVILASGPRYAAVSEVLDGAAVHRFKFLRRWWIHKYLATASPLNLVWAVWIVRVARHQKLDILVSSNIRVALATIVAARWLRLPVILDLEENNREAVKLYPKTRIHHHLVRNSHLVGWFESLAVRLADHVWVVVEERLATLSPRAPVPTKVSVLCNTPSLDEVHPISPYDRKAERPLTLAYIGLFAPGVRSIELILDSLKHLADQGQTVRLRIAGPRHMEGLVRQLGVEDLVTFSGLVPPDELSEWLREADVGVVAYDVDDFTNTTVSNKLFHYMAAGIPIVATNMAPTRRIIEEVGCGRIIPLGGTARDVAKILLELRDAPQTRVDMGARGQRAIVARYNWETEFVGALRTIQELHNRRTGRPEAKP